MRGTLSYYPNDFNNASFQPNDPVPQIGVPVRHGSVKRMNAIWSFEICDQGAVEYFADPPNVAKPMFVQTVPADRLVIGRLHARRPAACQWITTRR